MSDDRARVTVRLPEEAYEELCKELPSFSADTSRFQFLVQFYLDYKQLEQTPRCQCKTPTDGGAPTRNEANPLAHNQPQSEGRSEAEQTPQHNGQRSSSTDHNRSHSRESDQQPRTDS